MCALDEGRQKRMVLKEIKSDTEDETFECCRRKKFKDKYRNSEKIISRETTKQLINRDGKLTL